MLVAGEEYQEHYVAVMDERRRVCMYDLETLYLKLGAREIETRDEEHLDLLSV